MKKSLFVFVTFLLFGGCAISKGAPEIPVNPVSTHGSKKGLAVTMFRNSDGGYTINTTGMEIPNEKKDVVKALIGTEQIGTFLMVYDTITESFFLLPAK